MQSNPITVQMVVKNEDRFIWYSISSVLPYVEKILVTDTGSSDNTIKIIRSFKSKKIVFNSQNIRSRVDLTAIRQSQIDKTETDWFWVVDGDEIYPYSLCREIVNIIKKEGDKLEGIVVGRYDLLGDVYHYQSEKVGTYNLFGRRGHWVLRLINKKNIPGLYVKGEYPYEGYYDKEGLPIIDHPPNNFRFTQRRLFHAMYLRRSSLGGNLGDTFHRNKRKTELGIKMPKNITLPEVFKLSHPKYVPDVLGKRSVFYEIVATFITPIKILKRRIWRIFH